jgi:hypothetical protein
MAHRISLGLNSPKLFVVGFRDKEMAKKFKFPEPVRLTKTIKSFISKSVADDRYYYDSRFDCFKAVINAKVNF